MFSSFQSDKNSALSLLLGFMVTFSAVASPSKFGIKKTEDGSLIYLTDAGDDFVNSVAKQQVNGRLRLVTKKEAYEWMDRFIKLSNKKAQQSPDFTPVNNLYRHLELCDEILGALILKPGELQKPLAEDEKVPEKRKEKLKDELNNLRTKLREDIQELVSDNSRPNMKILVEFYDKALLETLDIN